MLTIVLATLFALAVNVAPYSPLGHSEFSGDSALAQSAGEQLADSGGIRIADPTGSVALSPSSPALGSHIGVVFTLRSQEQMLGADARRVIATVQDGQPISDSAVSQLPGETVGRYSFAATNAEQSVSSFQPAGSPQPAFAGLIDLIPESGNDRLILHLDLLSRAAVPPAANTGAGVSLAQFYPTLGTETRLP